MKVFSRMILVHWCFMLFRRHHDPAQDGRLTLRRSLRSLCTAFFALAVCGCGAGDGSPKAPEVVSDPASELTGSTSQPDSQPKKARIALVMKSLANELFSTIAEGAAAHADEHAEQYELIITGIPDETDLSAQVALIEQMIAQEVDAIVVAPADSQAMIPVLKQAHDTGIVLVNIDNRLDQNTLKKRALAVPFVGPDDRTGARAVGEFLASKLKSGDSVAILEGMATSDNGQQRKLGFEDAMKSAGMKIAESQPASWETSIADQTTAAILTAHPEIKAILACNDSMALGALSAATAANRKDVLIAGFDGISAVQMAIRNGQILVTADQHGDQLAVNGIEFALEILSHRGQSSGDKETPVDLVTAETLFR